MRKKRKIKYTYIRYEWLLFSIFLTSRCRQSRSVLFSLKWKTIVDKIQFVVILTLKIVWRLYKCAQLSWYYFRSRVFKNRIWYDIIVELDFAHFRKKFYSLISYPFLSSWFDILVNAFLSLSSWPFYRKFNTTLNTATLNINNSKHYNLDLVRGSFSLNLEG